MSSLRFEEVTKRFGNVRAVDGISFEISHGEFVVMLGPTGAGKTTTLKLTAGIYKPDKGNIYIDNELVNDVHPIFRDVAFVFQNYILYPNMTVYENLAFPLKSKFRNLSNSKVDETVKRVARMLHIEHLLNRMPQNLSGGEQQRVALGRALVRKPKIFLMDEPLTNLDAKLREEMRTELKRIHKELGETFFFVTHDYVEAFSMADRIIVLNEGKIEQIGTPSEIYDEPASLFVASFISSPPLNTLSGFVEESSFILKAKDKDIKTNLRIEGLEGKEVIVGIRPEDLILSRERCESVIFDFPGEVYIVEDLGTFSVITINFDGIFLRQKYLGYPDVKPAERVWVGIDGPVFYFDRDTGRRLR